ncbi:MAG: Gfo/Idh/MocA family oxidoreductase [Verrucomicrobia bacterium]|nr:Gfo/Idh/MocA family oxidoreductase [Verrucomicrobiota bacterium]
MSKPYRIGILGCGGIATSHAANLSKHPQAELVAFCDVETKRTARFNQEFAAGRAAEFTDHIQMFDKAGLDIVWICLPPFAHDGQLEAAARRGIHVFIEKPISLDMKRAESMTAAVEKGKVRSLVGFMNRFGGAIERFKSEMDSGRAGKPGVMQVRYFCNSLHAPWWREKTRSGGQIVEQIIHSYDLTRHLFGPIKSVYTYATNQFHKNVERYTSEDISASVIIFKSGAVATVTGCNGAIPGQWINDYRVVTERFTAEFVNSNNAVIHDTRDHSNVEKLVIESKRDLFRWESDDLFAAIEKKRDTRCPLHDAAKTQRLVLAAGESAEKGRPVELNI